MFQKAKEIINLKAIHGIFILIVLLMGSLIFGCSPTTRYRVLTFFFDGVPPLDESRNSNAADSLQTQTASNVNQSDSTAQFIRVWWFHPNVIDDNDCTTCHDPKKSFALIDEPEKLCISCHDVAEAEVVHTPAEGGTCTECHNPHGSKNEYLLLVESDSLCFQCHDKNDLWPSDAVSVHEHADAGTCIACHDPHASKNSMLLVETGEALCFQCHDEKSIRPDEAASIHIPVEEGSCSDCHTPHGSKNPFLLTEAENLICLECHDKADLSSTEPHQNLEQTGCIKCHQPHYSDKAYLIR